MNTRVGKNAQTVLASRQLRGESEVHGNSDAGTVNLGQQTPLVECR
jgi:hypothetical protein